MQERPSPPPPSSSTRYRVVVVVVLAAAIAAFAAALLTADTEEDEPVTSSGRIDVVERVVPSQGAEVVRQSEIGIDLRPGHEARLVVDGVEVPQDELRIVEAQNQVFFTPGDGKAVERLRAGRNCVSAVVWRSDTGRGVDDQTVRWCFSVL